LFRAITKPDGQLPTKVDKNLHFKWTINRRWNGFYSLLLDPVLLWES
jgi:hypothetical protein